jgi:ABC-2 type transport system permease protein
VLSVIERPPSAQLAQQKHWLVEPLTASPHHLALVVIPEDAVTLGPDKTEYGTYELYVSKGLNDATESVIHDALREALVSARMNAQGVDRTAIDRTERVTRPDAIVVLPDGERPSARGVRRFLPYICGLLLFIGVITGGQALMYTMIEEKSSRVVEVLLAAVSPLELMWGKLLAQFAIGLMVLSVYVGLGVLALVQFAVSGALEPVLVIDLGLLFIVSYLTYGALMLMIGAAVDQLADANSLLGPVMMLLVIPYVLTTFIGMAPNSLLAVTLSFVPPINTFIMLARLASDSPPPAWQVAATLGVGLAFACLVLWFAAKVFKIGLLMHGKPPSVGTLIRWARMA